MSTLQPTPSEAARRPSTLRLLKRKGLVDRADLGLLKKGHTLKLDTSLRLR